MTTVTSGQTAGQPEADQVSSVVKASLLAAGSFATSIGTVLAVAGEWRISDTTLRYAITMIGVIAAAALGITAVYVWRRR
jgi:hypothetical protein